MVTCIACQAMFFDVAKRSNICSKQIQNVVPKVKVVKLCFSASRLDLSGRLTNRDLDSGRDVWLYQQCLIILLGPYNESRGHLLRPEPSNILHNLLLLCTSFPFQQCKPQTLLRDRAKWGKH